MSNTKIQFLGPLTDRSTSPVSRGRRLTGAKLAFLLVVGIPTFLAAAYLLFVASPRYVSEARFIVRSPSEEQPSALGVALQGVGLSSASTNAFAIHEYLESRDAVNDLETRINLRALYGHPSIDPISRTPTLFAGASRESFYKGFNRYITVGYDSSTGISTLRVEAFSTRDARNVAVALLDSGETLINRLNQRAARDSVIEAERTLAEARLRLASAQAQLTTFRSQQRFIDPRATAEEGAKLMGELSVTLATLQAERAQLAVEAPESPQLVSLDGRIAAYRRQIEVEQGKLAGAQTSLAPQISVYETLTLEREFADRMVASASIALNSAQLDARRQQLYLDRIVNPNLPDKPTEPRRWLALLAVFTTLLLAYGVGWLIWAGLRESEIA